MRIETKDRLTLICLTPEQRATTCSYWYLLQSRHSPYTAFRTRKALEFFLETRKLRLSRPLPEKLGEHAVIDVEGITRTVSHGEMAEMPRAGRRILYMSNGSYTLGILTEDEKGPVVHYLAPSADRLTYDHNMARDHEDAGHDGPMSSMI